MRLVLPRLYVILDAARLPWEELTCALVLAESSVRLVQYRNKTASAGELLRASRELAEFFRGRGVWLVVNDRPDVALLAGAAGVHVGQEDLSVADARRLVGSETWVGVSTHDEEQFRRALATSADYIAVGPVFPTETKENPSPVVGVEFIRRARALTDRPIVAIGGITLERASEVLAAGADSLAVVSDIWRAPDPRQRIRQYQELIAASAAAA